MIMTLDSIQLNPHCEWLSFLLSEGFVVTLLFYKARIRRNEADRLLLMANKNTRKGCMNP